MKVMNTSLHSQKASIPVYRHPHDTKIEITEWSPAVRRVRDELHTLIGTDFNHCLVQYYRTGHDHISEHSDKTLDIVPETPIGDQNAVSHLQSTTLLVLLAR